MDRNSVSWSGPMPAVITPFDRTGSIDANAFSANIRRLLDHGATGVVVGGCTGEFWALRRDEREALFELGVAAADGRGTVIAGTGAVTAPETIALTQSAQAAGCDGALILPPYFVQLTDNEIADHFSTVCDAVDIPIVVYNIPGNAVNAVPPDLADRLADLENVVAFKESSGDWNNFYATLLRVKDRLRVFCGPSSVFGAPAVELGADGTIDCFPNVWLPGGLDLYYTSRDADRDKAADLQEIGHRLTDLFTSDGRTLYPSTKAAMDFLGLGGGTVRAPLRPLDGTALAGLHDGLRDLGFSADQQLTAPRA